MRIKTIASCLVMLSGVFLGGVALAEDAIGNSEKHCPANSKSTHTFLASSDTNKDKTRLNALAADIVRTKTPVCLLGFVDGPDPAYAKKLTIRRVSWVMDMLVGKGVPRDTISAELRPSTPDQSKADVRQVLVILGN